MAFMIPEVVEGDWLVVDGPMGGEVVDVDVVGSEWAAGLVRDIAKSAGSVVLENAAVDYFENHVIHEAEVIHGWCGRFTAPGYMDRTDWDGPHLTEEEACASLVEVYPDDFEPDYDRMTSDEEQAILENLVRDMSPAQILGIGNVRAEVMEHLNNEVLDAWASDNPGKVRFVDRDEEGEEDD
jgi:hypothetical protein